MSSTRPSAAKLQSSAAAEFAPTPASASAVSAGSNPPGRCSVCRCGSIGSAATSTAVKAPRELSRARSGCDQPGELNPHLTKASRPPAGDTVTDHVASARTVNNGVCGVSSWRRDATHTGSDRTTWPDGGLGLWRPSLCRRWPL